MSSREPRRDQSAICETCHLHSVFNGRLQNHKMCKMSSWLTRFRRLLAAKIYSNSITDVYYSSVTCTCGYFEFIRLLIKANLDFIIDI